ncbi:MAG: threonine synthase [Candidatus Marinimicrobia bacterium]|nr:threonine synthase [Candidatus Neomarinimicrobiota bacterium]
MKYLSTRNNNLDFSFFEILFQGLSKDGGLFLPHEWPLLDINSLKNKTYEELAIEVIHPYVSDEISKNDLKKIIDDSYKHFSNPKIAPVTRIEQNKYILELFYGPTFAFKDYALQFLGNLFTYALPKASKKLTVLGATSGDTGSAAIHAFRGKQDINVFILHPHNRVSDVQRRQMTTVQDDNIFNIAIKGNFDDCQKIVKELFIDDDLQQKTSLTAINSINWARLMAQVVYYFWAYLQIDEQEINFIVPSGNFGNVFSANVAKKMGLPINKLHITTNQNDILHSSIKNGLMKKNDVTQTYSPSMDIQVSSNFERQLFESSGRDSKTINNIFHEFSKNNLYRFDKKIQHDLQSNYSTTAVSNDETLDTIKQIKQKYNYLADPHTSTGLHALLEKDANLPWVSLACAHPAKFGDAIEKATGEPPILPKDLSKLFDKEEKMTILDNNKDFLKSLILKNL